MVNRLQSNITWSQRGNFLSIPTDCPQRDERMGWTGDINVFAPTAAFNMEVARFLGTKWLRDLRDAQRPDGAFTDVAPYVPIVGAGVAGWGDAGVTVPWTVWRRYGDTRVIEENYEAMVRWLAYLEEHSTGYLRPAEGYGDWLNVGDETPKDVVATAYFAHSARLVSEMAAAVGREGDARRYRELFESVREAFNEAYVSSDGRIRGDTQTAYVLALHMELLPEEKRAAAARRLVEHIEARGWHLSTGFLGTPHLLPVLTEAGRADVAYRLLNQRTFPSWLYEVERGATTTWERWDSIKPDGSFNDPAMNSFNHYAYGAVGDWLYRYVAGISPEEPGYRRILIRPRPGGGLDRARGELESPYGRILSEWRLRGGKLRMRVSIPPNTRAGVCVPARDAREVRVSPPVPGANPSQRDGCAVFELGSGTYEFRSRLPG
nr:alpha-L-rhamnosidase C-terminal domain-containing protein [Rubrobacter xylanophilus]